MIREANDWYEQLNILILRIELIGDIRKWMSSPLNNIHFIPIRNIIVLINELSFYIQKAHDHLPEED